MKVLAFPGPKQRLPDETVEEVTPPPEPPRPTFSGEEPPPQYDRVTIRAITVAIVLSLFVHILLFVLPLIKPVDKEMKAPGEEGPLQVSIASAPPPGPQPKPEPPPTVEQPQPQPTTTPPKQIQKPRTPPRSQLAIERGPRPPFVVPPPIVQQPPQPEPQPQPVPQRPVSDDFATQVASQQKRRRDANGGMPDSITETDDERANRIAKANILAQQRSSSPGQDPDQAGGIFDLRHTGITDAEYVFNGWNDTFQRTNPETREIRVRPGEDIRIAVIRDMINIIRKRRPDSFEWRGRLGKTTTMSARVQDQAELEIFLMKEFYPQDPRAQGR